MIGKAIALCAILTAGAALAADLDAPDDSPVEKITDAPGESSPEAQITPTSCPRGQILRVKLHTCVEKGSSLDITSKGKGWVVETEDRARVRHPKPVHHETRREPPRPYKVQIIQDTVKFVPVPNPPQPQAAPAPVAPEPIVPKVVRVIPLATQSSGPLLGGPPSWAGALRPR